MNILLENVRTFDGAYSVPIKPLTILVGENSAGKTTLMGMMAALLDAEGFPFNPIFDSAPYSLGSYDTIATFKGGRYGRAKHFSIGYEYPYNDSGKLERMYSTFENDNGRVSLKNLEIIDEDKKINISMARRDGRTQEGVLDFLIKGKNHSVAFRVPRISEHHGIMVNLHAAIVSSLFDDDRQFEDFSDIYRELFNVLHKVDLGHVVSVAPIRTRPQRTYSQAKETFEPSGDHIPFILDRLLSDASNRSERRRVVNALERFGEDSGLFGNVSIKKLGSKATDPFQLMVSVGGRARNLIDVGYGVSQALPVVVQTVLESPNSIILMQQPEVHLHPRAQAALGTFFAKIIEAGDRRMVIETHSDFIIDRIRQEIGRGSISAGSVGLLFFERHGYETSVHSIVIDDNGNIIEAPPSYRSFFFEEEMGLLSRVQ